MPHNPKVAGSNPAPATTSILLILLKKFTHGRPFLLLFREPHREHGRRQFFGLVLLAYIGLALIEVHELRCVVAAHQALGVDRDRALALVAERASV